MFGTYRFILSTMVVLGHLASPIINWTGVYAVFCFYLLSGYLMTLILTRRYGFDFDGLCRYAINRILRIYPPYLFVLVLSIFIVMLIPETAQRINPALSMPISSREWAHNLFIFGLNGEARRLIPPAWSIDVELFFYCSMALIFAKNRTLCTIWFLFSLIALGFMLATGADFGQRYGSIIGASLPFSLGSMTYYYKDNLSIVSPKHLPMVGFLFLLYALFSSIIWVNPIAYGFYIALILGFCIQVSLANIKQKEIPSWVRTMDSRLGDLSYPLFLCHWHVGSIIAFLTPFGISSKGILLFIVVFLASTLLAFGIHQLIERPIEKIRKHFKGTEDEQWGKSRLISSEQGGPGSVH